MADAAVEFLLNNLRELFLHQVELVRGGDKVVRWIENELGMLIPQLERIEGVEGRLPNVTEELTRRIREAIPEAEDLAQTHTKRMIQMNSATFKAPIYAYRVRDITKQLFRIKDEITDDSYRLLNLAEGPEQQHPPPDEQRVPSYLRRFIHHFQLFPRNFQVPARRLIVLWVAEGFVHSNNYGSESAEKTAERYLKELIDLKVVVVVKRKRSGKVSSCVINVDERDKLLGDIDSDYTANFLQRRDGQIRRLVDCNDDSGGGDSYIQVSDTSRPVPEYRDVIAFFSFNTREGSKPGKDLGDFLRKCISAKYFIWLKVLDLERVFRPQLPKTIGKLIALKYLGLRWTYLEQLPDSVNKLFNLQVLDVKHTYISVLPKSIWQMEYLRHLYLSEAYRTKFPDPPSKITLTALQTLWGAFVDEDTCVENGLDTLLNIRKLGLSCRSRASAPGQMSVQLKAIDKWISNLKFLESLRLKSRDESGDAADLHLTSLEGNKNLSTVYLLGKVNHLILCELPLSLTDITLSGSELNVDPMRFLGRLPNLVILRLLAKSVVHTRMNCSRRGFRRLKFLWIWKLENLVELEAEEGSLPCLEELEVRSCDKLEKLPDRLLRLENLVVKLTSMPPICVQKATASYALAEYVGEDDQYILTNRLQHSL